MERNPIRLLPIFRVENLTDGVFSIAMTILVFDLKVPPVSIQDLAPTLAQQWPSFLAYAISFGTLGVYWLGDRGLWHVVKAADHTLHWLSIVFMAFVALVPFFTEILARHPFEKLALGLYGANMMLIGITVYAKLRHVYGAGLMPEDLPGFMKRYAESRCLLAPGCYAAAWMLSFLDERITLAIYTLIPWLYIVPSAQRMWFRLVEGRSWQGDKTPPE
ncbi:MAG: TMEM175 family protein [Acidobacteriota bacterium]